MHGRTILKALLLCAGAVLLLTAPETERVLGHHSFPAQYDAEKPITLSGTLTKMDWRNPHVYFYLDVEQGGEYVNWAFEMGSPIALERLGWNRNSARIGDLLEVEGSLARDGSNLVNARTVVLTSSGRRMFAGSSQDEGDQ